MRDGSRPRTGALLGHMVLRRWELIGRRLPRLLLFVLAVGLLSWGFGRETPARVVVGMASLPVGLLALSWPLWRAPEEGRPEVLRWRSRQFRICWRIGVLMLMLAGVGVMVLGYAYEKRYNGLDLTPAADAHWRQVGAQAGSAARWLALLSPLPVLLDPLLWALWSRPFRPAVRAARAVEELQRRLNGGGRGRLAMDFDPTQGYAGRPKPVRRNEPPYERDEPFTVQAEAHRSVAWDGTALVLTGRRRAVSLPIDRVGELVVVTEDTLRLAVDEVLVLDHQGRRLATLPKAVRLPRGELSRLASAAGIPFAEYALGYTREATFVSSLLFPRAKGHVQLTD